MSRLSPLLRPRMIGAHVLVVVLVFTMLNLSAWQFRRLDQRKAFNAEVRERGTDVVGEYIGVRRQDAVANVETWG